MKKYYLCRESTDPKIIGWGYPQCAYFEKDISEYKKKIIYRVNNYFRKGEFEKIIKVKHLNGIKLSGDAKRTDILSCTMVYMPLLNNAAREVFEKFNLGVHYFLPITITKRNREFEYYFLYFNLNFVEYVDFSHSDFELKRFLRDGIYGTINNLNSFSEYLQLKKELIEQDIFIDPKTIILNDDFPEDIDMFGIRDIALYDFYLSEALCEKIRESGIKGLNIQEEYIAIKE